VCGLKEDQAEQSQGSETDHSRSGRLKKSPSVEVEAEPREKTEKKERSQLLQSRLIQWIGEECKKVTWLLKRCGNGKGYLIETRFVSVRPSGLRIMRAEV
jgi:hypothetical protein